MSEPIDPRVLESEDSFWDAFLDRELDERVTLLEAALDAPVIDADMASNVLLELQRAEDGIEGGMPEELAARVVILLRRLQERRPQLWERMQDEAWPLQVSLSLRLNHRELLDDAISTMAADPEVTLEVFEDVLERVALGASLESFATAVAASLEPADEELRGPQVRGRLSTAMRDALIASLAFELDAPPRTESELRALVDALYDAPDREALGRALAAARGSLEAEELAPEMLTWEALRRWREGGQLALGVAALGRGSLEEIVAATGKLVPEPGEFEGVLRVHDRGLKQDVAVGRTVAALISLRAWIPLLAELGHIGAEEQEGLLSRYEPLVERLRSAALRDTQPWLARALTLWDAA